MVNDENIIMKGEAQEFDCLN